MGREILAFSCAALARADRVWSSLSPLRPGLVPSWFVRAPSGPCIIMHHGPHMPTTCPREMPPWARHAPG